MTTMNPNWERSPPPLEIRGCLEIEKSRGWHEKRVEEVMKEIRELRRSWNEVKVLQMEVRQRRGWIEEGRRQGMMRSVGREEEEEERRRREERKRMGERMGEGNKGIERKMRRDLQERWLRRVKDEVEERKKGLCPRPN